MKKVFKPKEFQCIKQLIGKKFDKLFYAPVSGILSLVDMLVFNFDSDASASLHAFSFARIIKNNKILLTSSDLYFNCDYEQLKHEETQSNGIENTLLQKNIEKVNQLLANRTVVKASVTELGDVKIVFDNMVKIEIIVDAVYKDCECYRLLYCEGGYVYHHIVSYDESGKALYEHKVCLDED